MGKTTKEQAVKGIKTKCFLVAFGIFAVLGLTIGFSSVADVYAEIKPQGMVQSGESVRVEYDYALAQSRFSPFAYYEGKSSMEGAAGTGIVNSVKRYDSALDSSEKLSGNPMLLETAESGSRANGAMLSLGCYSGEFSIVANALQTSYANSAAYKTSLYFDSKIYQDGKFNGREPISYGSNSFFDFTTVQFDFIDLNDPSNVFTLRQIQTDKSDSAANYFTYKGKTIERRSWNSLTGVHYPSAMPIMFRFNPKEKTFTMGQRYTQYDINGSAQHGSGGNDGSDFGFFDFAMSEDFEVRVSFYGVMDGSVTDYWNSSSDAVRQYERRGRLVIYSLDGQPMTGALSEMKPLAEPSLIALTDKEIYKGVPCRIPVLRVYDLLGGVRTLSDAVTVTAADGKLVAIVENSFVPDDEGVFTLSYVTRWNGREITRNYSLLSVVDTEPPTIELDGEYAEKYIEGTKVKILGCEVKDNSKSIQSSSVRVFCGKHEITDSVSDGYVTVFAGETYRIEYNATDCVGLNANPVIKEFGVYALSVPAKKTVELSPTAQFLPQPDLMGDAVFTISVYSVKDTSFSNPMAENVTRFLFPCAGEYLLRYTIIGLGQNEYQKTTVSSYLVVDTTPPTIVLEDRYEKKYKVGQSVKLIDASVFDNSREELTYEITILRNGKKLPISENVLKLERSGEYTLTYTVVDAGGNMGSAVFTFTAEGGGNTSWLWISISAIIAIIGVSIVVGFIIRSKRTKKVEGKENENDD